jgi:hypothetical protein
MTMADLLSKDKMTEEQRKSTSEYWSKHLCAARGIPPLSEFEGETSGKQQQARFIFLYVNCLGKHKMTKIQPGILDDYGRIYGIEDHFVVHGDKHCQCTRCNDLIECGKVSHLADHAGRCLGEYVGECWNEL